MILFINGSKTCSGTNDLISPPKDAISLTLLELTYWYLKEEIKQTVSMSEFISLFVKAISLSYSKSAPILSPLIIAEEFNSLARSTVSVLKGITSTFLRSDTADTASGDITFSGGSGAITLATNSDITFGATGSWSGEKVKIQHHDDY